MTNAQALIHNKFDFVITDAKTGEVKRHVTSYNMILDQCYARLVRGYQFLSYIRIGTGTGTLASTRTTLFTDLTGKRAVFDSINYAAETPWSRWYIQFAPEEIVGSTITEVGIAYESSSSYMVTHSLLKDDEGNTISITKTDSEILTIYATIYASLTVDTSAGYYIHKMPAGFAAAFPTKSNNVLMQWLLQHDVTSWSPTGFTAKYLSGLCNNPYDTTIGGLDTCNVKKINSQALSTYIYDATAHTITIPAARLSVSTLNQPIKTIDCSTIGIGLTIPSTAYAAQSFTNIALTAEDTGFKKFTCPAYNLTLSSLVTKVNGTEVTKTTRTHPILQTYGFGVNNLLGRAFYETEYIGYHNNTGMTIYFAVQYYSYNMKFYSYNYKTDVLTLLYSMDGSIQYMFGAVEDTIYFAATVNSVTNIYRYNSTDGLSNITSLISGYRYSNCIIVEKTLIGLVRTAMTGIDFYRLSGSTWTLESSIAFTGTATEVPGDNTYNTPGYRNFYDEDSGTVWFQYYYSSAWHLCIYKKDGTSWTLQGNNTMAKSYYLVMSPNNGRLVGINKEWRSISGSGTGVLSLCSFTNTSDVWTKESEIDGQASGWTGYSDTPEVYNGIMLNDTTLTTMQTMGTRFLFDTNPCTKYTAPIMADAALANTNGINTYQYYHLSKMVWLYDSATATKYLCCPVHYWENSSGTNPNSWAGLAISKVVEDYIVEVILDTAVTSSDAVTADFTSNCINKTANNVLDTTYTLTFGEGS
jgi:hypothetical protein